MGTLHREPSKQHTRKEMVNSAYVQKGMFGPGTTGCMNLSVEGTPKLPHGATMADLTKGLGKEGATCSSLGYSTDIMTYPDVAGLNKQFAPYKKYGLTVTASDGEMY